MDERPQWTMEQRHRIEELIDEHRRLLHDSLDDLTDDDTIASVQATYRQRWETSRVHLAGLRSDEIVDGRVPRPVWALELQVLRELAQHAGHAGILREQLLAAREPAR